MGYVVAVAGATGVVGEEMLSVLHDRKFPADRVKALASSRSAGRKVRFGAGEVPVEEMSAGSFRGVDIALFALDKDLAREMAPRAAAEGAVVIDNSSAFRMEEAVPLVVPEINPEKALVHSGIIANPNCSTAIMLMALYPVYRIAGVKRVVAATYQAVSGAGREAMDELLRQIADVSKGKKPSPSAFPHQIAYNIIPRIGSIEAFGYTTEEVKMQNETRKIIGDPGIRVTTTCVRIPVLRAHSVAANIETARKVSVAQVREALASAPGVDLVDDPEKDVYPMPLDASGKYNVLVGRVREDRSAENCIDLFVSGDQLLKGAALNAVQIAEVLVDPGRKLRA